ncbi:MAG TPA: hypothetical protein VFN87_07410 [Solirubrobacteraceae bacterium]|nr:hypothetical protein [Solirubrobacteraceae bacterium]
MSRRTLIALVVVMAGGWAALGTRLLLERRRLRAADEELARWHNLPGSAALPDGATPAAAPAPTPAVFRGDGDLAAEWEQAILPQDS